MLVGHLATAFVAKSVEPKAPLGWLVAGAFALDLLWPLFLLAGVERVVIAPGETAFTPLAFEHYPWSHSLAFAVFWGVVACGAARIAGLSARVAGVIGAIVVSHWLLDLVVHIPDLPLWPSGPVAGFGLWNFPVATLVVEGAFYAAALAAYTRAFPTRDRIGTLGLWSLAVFMGVIWASGPFTPPPPSVEAVAWVTLALWILPFWAWRVAAHRQS